MLTCSNGLLKILYGSLLALESLALLVMKPSQLLKNLGMVGIPLQHSLISSLCTIILQKLPSVPTL